MRAALTITLALLTASASAAPCTARDAWTGPDKTKHFLAGAALGAAGTVRFGDARSGFLFGAGVGAVKELADMRGWIPGSHTCSLQDFVATAAGAAAGAYGTAWLVLPQRGGVVVAYTKTF